MAETRLLIVKDAVEVLSELEREDLSNGCVCIWVTSTMEGEVPHRAPLVIVPSTRYSREQFEFDVEEFRHRKADTVVGRAKLREIVGSNLAPAAPDGQVPRVSAPRFAPPGKGAAK